MLYSRDLYLFVSLLKILVDGGYTGEKFAQIVKSLTGAVVEVVKRNEAYKFEVLPKRWIVERTFGCSTNIVGFGKTATGSKGIF